MSKVAVVTGGAGNIGQAIVERLAQDDHRVVILDMNPEAGNQAVAKFAGRNIALDFHCANLADEAAVKITFAVCDLAGDDAKHVTGQTMHVNSGRIMH